MSWQFVMLLMRVDGIVTRDNMVETFVQVVARKS
jgi:hypothetical protein